MAHHVEALLGHPGDDPADCQSYPHVAVGGRVDAQLAPLDSFNVGDETSDRMTGPDGFLTRYRT